MSVKWNTKKDFTTKMLADLKAVNGRTVEVGANSHDSWLAGIHEYGCRIPVKDNARAFLHHLGLHLKDSTKEITIPERSFLRSGHDENADSILKQTSRAIAQVLSGEMTVDSLLDLYGEQMASAIKKYMRDLKKPPNHPFTQEQKGSSNPLVDTGQLVESITWRKDGF